MDRTAVAFSEQNPGFCEFLVHFGQTTVTIRIILALADQYQVSLVQILDFSKKSLDRICSNCEIFTLSLLRKSP